MTDFAPGWRLPIDYTHRLCASAGALTFVGGTGDFDANGRIRNPGTLDAQIGGALENLEASLQSETCGLDDVVRLKAYYQSNGDVDEWQVLAKLANQFGQQPAPVISVLPVLMQPFEGQKIQLQAIAQRHWRSLEDIRAQTVAVPAAHRASFDNDELTRGLRAGELIVTQSRTAADGDDNISDPEDGIAQTRTVMDSLRSTLETLGASFQDAVKKEGYYFGTTREQWAGMAAQRAAYFKEPGPVATVVPCQVLWPDAAQTKIEVIAMRQTRGGFDKYVPREDSWPERVWDWPIPLPYRQGSRLRDLIWLGGQVPSEPFNNARGRVHAGQRAAQTSLTMSYIEDLLRVFNRSPADLKIAICHFQSNGTEASTLEFVRTLQDCMGGALPPLTLVPQPQMHTVENTVEIWGVAAG